jgi:hypothetical protein
VRAPAASRENEAWTRLRPPAPPALEPEDYYFEGPNLVFTAAYHLKRGFLLRLGMQALPLWTGPRRKAGQPEFLRKSSFNFV